MEVIVAEMATTPMSVGIYERLSEPRNATELQYRILSKGCYSRSRVRRGLGDEAVPTVPILVREGEEVCSGMSREDRLQLLTAVARIASCR